MRKLIILMMVLFVIGCASKAITPDEITAANKICAEFGGVQKMIRMGDSQHHNSIDVYCNNGVNFKIYGVDKYLSRSVNYHQITL